MRTKILAPVLAIGFALMMGVAGGVAVFSDTETSGGNTFEAGQLDLKIDFGTFYPDGDPPYEDDSELIEEPINLDEWDDDQLIKISDVKPGDKGIIVFSLHVEDNPAWAQLDITDIRSGEGAVTEPEEEAEGGDVGDTGELDDAMEFTSVKFGKESKIHEGILITDYGEDFELSARTIPLDGVRDETTDPDTEIDPLEACDEYYIVVEWEIPTDVGNEIQGDTLEIDLDFNVSQARYQGNYDKVMW